MQKCAMNTPSLVASGEGGVIQHSKKVIFDIQKNEFEKIKYQLLPTFERL